MSRTIGTRSTVHRDRRLTLLAIVILSSVSACGRYLPSHIHDPGAEKTASDLQSNISEYQINQSGLYDNLAVNLERFRVEEDELINMMAANYANALVTKAPDFTWREIKDNLTELKMRETALRNEIIKKLNADLVQRGVATAELKDANQAIGKLKNEIAKEKARTKAWEKAAERFREAISKLPASLGELSTKAAGLSALLTSVEGLDAKRPPQYPDSGLGHDRLQEGSHRP